MLTINILNDGTGTEESANYRYAVLVNDKWISEGKIKNHNRGDGWVKLVALLLDVENELNSLGAGYINDSKI